MEREISNMIGNDDGNKVTAYRCKTCGNLFYYDANKDKIHIFLDKVQRVVAYIFLILFVGWLIYEGWKYIWR